jgi:hypothetical protein
VLRVFLLAEERIRLIADLCCAILLPSQLGCCVFIVFNILKTPFSRKNIAVYPASSIIQFMLSLLGEEKTSGILIVRRIYIFFSQ